jgi:prolipoprotein diacylglyceryltransferase
VEIHALFDGYAWLVTALTAVLLRRFAGDLFPAARRSSGYLAALVVGGALGAFGLGTLNTMLAGQVGLSRSIEGALAGAILAVELYKWRTGLAGRTAALFALPLALGIGVGRIGCFLAGLDDFTYGTPTTLPWGHDFGDGVLRHPVQLYESAGMTLFALAYLWPLLRRDRNIIDNGFAPLVLWYGVERFGLEFLKPYPAVLAGLTVFQIVCIGLVLYALILLRPKDLPNARRARDFRAST